MSLLSELLEIVKQTALDAVSASKPTQIVFGKVIKIAPFKIKISQSLELTKEYFVISNTVSELMKNNKLKAGDSLIMIQMQGGQKFVLLDKAVSI